MGVGAFCFWKAAILGVPLTLDEKTFPSRLDLRGQAINRWLPGQELRVLDLGAGDGKLWESLRKKITVAEYTPVDPKPQIPGCLQAKITVSLLSSVGLKKYNVVDINSVPEPWEVWLSVAMWATTGTLVMISAPAPKNKGWLTPKQKALLGLPAEWAQVPANDKLGAFLSTRALQRGIGYAHVTEPVLTNERAKVSGYAVWCPGRDEKIEIVKVRRVWYGNPDFIENLSWLIPMALDSIEDGRPDSATVKYPKNNS